jgi:hypothetical protein
MRVLQNTRIGKRDNRRAFIKGAAFFAGSFWRGFNQASFAKDVAVSRITQVSLDLKNIHKWDESNGDTWDPFWADDDNLYAFNCDGRGFGRVAQNLSFNRLSGESMELLAGSAINKMDEYGKGGEKGADNATWKVCGQECIDGVFYAFVSRNTYGSDSGDAMLRQTAHNCSLIKSRDRGLSWTRSAQENARTPMWPGAGFGAPFFVHYGKNGGNVMADSASEFVYAVSTNGFWNDGDSYILGRVKRKRLPDLKAGDWSYYAGGDGSDGRNWSEHIDSARPILARPLKCGQGPICYIPSLGRYLLISWYNTEKMTKWFEPTRMQYDFFQAEHPWGPWDLIDSHRDDFIIGGHMYGPSLCAKFQRRKGDEVHLTMVTSGCPFDDVETGLYKMWQIPLILRTVAVAPAAVVRGDDARIHYAGQWHGAPEANRESPHTRYSDAAGGSAELHFHGSGVAYVAEMGPACGDYEIYFDNQRVKIGTLLKSDFPRMISVEVYARQGFERGPHSLRVVSKGRGGIAVESFRVTK